MTEEKKLKQKEYQERYDKKTQMVNIKYVLKDMDEYDELKRYLERTKQSANGFIKALIRNFLENGNTLSKYPPAKEEEEMSFYKFYGMGEVFERLMTILDNDIEKYQAVLDIYSQLVKDDILRALEDCAGEFEYWVDEELGEDIADGTVNMSSIETFKKDIEKCMSFVNINLN